MLDYEEDTLNWFYEVESQHRRGAATEALAHDVMNVITWIRNVRWIVAGHRSGL